MCRYCVDIISTGGAGDGERGVVLGVAGVLAEVGPGGHGVRALRRLEVLLEDEA